ncbi:histone-lysine N-methyltransferase SETMAR [Trichonephila clavipes]|uniref:Histone-lysine N-methyltransferase SETMAR n=1 Tax=Trichonephila clavipes TaxID=2585209 RepID=A0A8X6VEC0_TRICX|nr:histone-lysine N-methyltransferase SETMAR [Trichonephila clavipes]
MKVKQIKIYRQICEVYGQNAMSDSMVRRWDRHFNEGRSEVHDEERSGRPSLITEELVHVIDEKIKENRKFTISALPMEFPQISRSLMHEIATDKLKFHKFCARWVAKLLTESHKTKRMGCALEFLTHYHEGGVDFLSQIVTGDETGFL